MKIEITELIVRVPHRVSMETARIINDRIRAVLKLPDDVPVLILDGGMSIRAVLKLPDDVPVLILDGGMSVEAVSA